MQLVKKKHLTAGAICLQNESFKRNLTNLMLQRSHLMHFLCFYVFISEFDPLEERLKPVINQLDIKIFIEFMSSLKLAVC